MLSPTKAQVRSQAKVLAGVRSKWAKMMRKDPAEPLVQQRLCWLVLWVWARWGYQVALFAAVV